MFEKIVKRTLRVPVSRVTVGDAETITRQLDIALMEIGFKLSGELLQCLSKLHPDYVKKIANDLILAVRELVGDHVDYNVYFRDFPENVPDTLDFWTECIVDALSDLESAGKIMFQLSVGVVNLLDLPKYGRYQYSYEEMVVAHERFIPSIKDRMTVLHLGKTLQEECTDLYRSLVGSSIPLNEDDRDILRELATICLNDPQPEAIPIRENKAIVNQVRLENGYPLLVDTPTDILRLACALSGGDVTLQESKKFKSFTRKVRRALLKALDEVVKNSPAKLVDIARYQEQWKRLSGYLHPYEYELPYAQEVFAVATGEKRVLTLAAKVELAFANGNIGEAISLLSNAPGMLFRNLDRLIRSASIQETETLMETVGRVVPKVSGRVILSLIEHFQNRVGGAMKSRVFSNKKGTAFTTPEKRDPMESGIVSRLFNIFEEDLLRRMPIIKSLVVDREILNLATPLSDKNKASGFGIMPRGSIASVNGKILRFFMYWKQKSKTTDYDLSVLFLDESFQAVGQLSWTNLRNGGGIHVHSGDITRASNGASEFIDIDLERVECAYIVPLVNVFSGEDGEDFQEVKESLFGFMERTPEQKGKPFEPATVRVKSEVRGKGKVALPLVFIRNDKGGWTAKWLHLYLNGYPSMNRIENNRVTTSLLAQSIVERQYLPIAYLLDLMRRKSKSFAWYGDGEMMENQPVVYVGLEDPEGLPEGSTVVTLNKLQDLIPA